MCSSAYFQTVIAFGADNVDPLTVSTHFISTFLNFHIFSCEPVQKAVMRAFKHEVSSHTSVYIATEGDVLNLVDASWRRRPNGEDIRCCNQVPKYVNTTEIRGEITIKFRCQQRHHIGPKNIRVTPLQDLEGVRRFVGNKGDLHRFLIKSVKHEGGRECDV